MGQINTTVEYFMGLERITVSELARRTEIPQPVLYRIVTGDTEDPRLRTLRALARYFNISVSQLIGDEPLPFDTGQLPQNRVRSQVIPLLNWDDLSVWPQNREQLTNAIIHDQTGEGYFAIRMNDASMRPLIPEFAILIFQSARPLQDHDYALIRLSDNTVVFRQVVIDRQILKLKPLNSDYLSLTVTEGEYHVLGILTQARINYYDHPHQLQLVARRQSASLKQQSAEKLTMA